MSKLRAAVAALLACSLIGSGALILSGGHRTARPVPHGTASQSAMGSVHPAGWGGTPPGLELPAPRSAAETVEMFDATDAKTIPAHPFAQAGYTAGFWPDYPAERALWPTAHTISVAISARYHADCLDVEPRDAVPSEAGPWVLADIRAGFPKPCEYSDLSEMPAVEASDAAVLGPHWRSMVFLWLAWYRFIPGLVAGYDAVQWTDVARGLSLDESTVTLPFLSIAQPPYVPPAPLPVCFHRRMTVGQCAAARARILSWNQASAASWRAWHRAGCPRLLHRRGYFARGCGLWSQRGHYFTGRAVALEAAS